MLLKENTGSVKILIIFFTEPAPSKTKRTTLYDFSKFRFQYSNQRCGNEQTYKEQRETNGDGNRLHCGKSADIEQNCRNHPFANTPEDLYRSRRVLDPMSRHRSTNKGRGIRRSDKEHHHKEHGNDSRHHG